MIRALLLLLVACSHAAGVTPANASTCVARPPLLLGFAVSHVAPVYPTVDEGQLMLGAKAAQKIGATTLKIYFTPNYREKYREKWPEVHSLVELAETPQMRAVLEMPFKTFVLTTYTFANGVDGGFLDGFDELEKAAEYKELRAFSEYLLKAYKNSGKRFVLQNWEGDWAARAGFDKDRAPTEQTLASMRIYLDTRQEAITAARKTQKENGVLLDNAVEVNALLDDAPSVTSRIIAGSCFDAVSYSSWEALAPLYTNAPDALSKSEDNLRRAMQRLRAAAGKANVYLGEFGIAENDLAQGRKAADLVPAIVKASGGNVIWWQVFDNECPDGKCRGHGLFRPDGSRSTVLEAIGTKL